MLDQLESEKRIADALVRVAEEAPGTMAVSEVIDRLCRLCAELVPCDRSAVYLWSTRRSGYWPVGDFGTPAHVAAGHRGTLWRPGKILHEKRLLAGELVHLSREPPLEDDERRLLDDADLFALAIAPLRSRDRMLGSLNVGLHGGPDFDEGSLKIVRGVARQASTLIENALLLQHAESASRLRTRVAALAAALSAENDARRIGRLVCAEGAELFRVNGAVLLLREGDFLVASGAVPDDSPAERLRVPLAERDLPLVRAFMSGEPLFVNDVSDPPPPEARLAREFRLKCHLTIPLLGRAGTLGCLVFSDTRRPYRFRLDALDDARLLGAVATAALERARLFAELVDTNSALQRSEEHFRSLIELGSDIITILDADGVIRYESPSIERALGYAPDELIGVTPFAMIHPEDLPRVQEALSRRSQSGDPAELVDYRFRHKDGSWRVLQGSGKTSPEIGLIVSSRDVTARTEAEKAFREEAAISAALARVAQVLISSLDAAVILDGFCRVTTEVLECAHSITLLWRPEEDAFVPIAGYVEPPELWESLRLLRLPGAVVADHLARIETADLIELAAERERGLLGEILDHYETPVVLCMALRRGDQVIGIQTAARADRTATFSPSEFRIARGIAQLASTALANVRLVAELERANRLKSEFVSTMSHELRTPLNVILGFIEMVRDPDVTEAERSELYDRIGGAGRELLELIEGTLTVGKVEAGRDEARFQDVSLASLWRELGEVCARLPRAPEVRLEWSTDGAHGTFRTDPGKLKVILRNLVGNALKFTECGSVSAALTLAGDLLSIRVTDTGIGIEPDDQAAIFEMFRQADGSDTRRYGGTGLGLYIVRRFATQLGGTVAVRSTPGEGSVFEVTLPRRAPSA